MKPIATETTNLILKGNDDGVADLPVTCIEFEGGIVGVESCWQLSPEEIEEVVRTGKVYFLCLDHTHPPISINVVPTKLEPLEGGVDQ